MKHGHHTHSYPANKPIPREALRGEFFEPGKGWKKVRITSRRAGGCRSVMKRQHSRRARRYQKNLCR